MVYKPTYIWGVPSCSHGVPHKINKWFFLLNSHRNSWMTGGSISGHLHSCNWTIRLVRDWSMNTSFDHLWMRIKKKSWDCSGHNLPRGSWWRLTPLVKGCWKSDDLSKPIPSFFHTRVSTSIRAPLYHSVCTYPSIWIHIYTAHIYT